MLQVAAGFTRLYSKDLWEVGELNREPEQDAIGGRTSPISLRVHKTKL
jgi:hypothetical protein